MNTITVTKLAELKAAGEKITCLTAYDASFAGVVDQAGVELILVGDSLGMVVQGHNSTLPVTMVDIIYHTKAVTRVARHSLVIADMPFMSYADKTQALKNAGRLVKEAGAQMVKIEGGANQVETVANLISHNIPVCAHLGLEPQAVHKLGGYKVQGRDSKTSAIILSDAKELEAAGADLLVLECVPEDLAQKITAALKIPTIGIGAGAHCDGQVLVLYDLLGVSADKTPKFAKNYLQGQGSVAQAVESFKTEVKSGKFPDATHSFK